MAPDPHHPWHSGAGATCVWYLCLVPVLHKAKKTHTSQFVMVPCENPLGSDKQSWNDQSVNI